MKRRFAVLCLRAALFLSAALALGACGSVAPDPAGRVEVVASTDVYGDIAASIGGSHVVVTSLIDSAAQDPHSFQASAHDELAVAKADVLVENGGGYDDFMATLRTSVGRTGSTVLDAVALSGHDPLPAGGNEHVWYDLPTIRVFVRDLAATLAAKDPRHRDSFRRNAASYLADIAGLQSRERALRQRYAGAGVLVTEPVPLYLLQACGLRNRTPAQFSAAVEDGTGVPARSLAQTLHLLGSGAVRLLAYNEQTSGPETDQVIAAARAGRIPAIGVTETLPAHEHYLAWMRHNLAAVRTALGSRQ